MVWLVALHANIHKVGKDIFKEIQRIWFRFHSFFLSLSLPFSILVFILKAVYRFWYDSSCLWLCDSRNILTRSQSDLLWADSIRHYLQNHCDRRDTWDGYFDAPQIHSLDRKHGLYPQQKDTNRLSSQGQHTYPRQITSYPTSTLYCPYSTHRTFAVDVDQKG